VNTRLYQILSVGQFPVVEVQVSLGGTDVRVPQQSPDVLDSLLAADFRAALVPGQIQHEIAGQTRQIAQPGIRPAEIRHAPCLAGRGQDDFARVAQWIERRFPKTAVSFGKSANNTADTERNALFSLRGTAIENAE
jgi:hypothetical protein